MIFIITVIIAGLLLLLIGLSKMAEGAVVDAAENRRDVAVADNVREKNVKEMMIHKAEQGHTELARQVKEDQLRTQQRELDARRSAAQEAEKLGLTLDAYLQARLTEGKFQGQMEYERFKILLEVERERLLAKNDIDLGLYLREQEKKLLNEKTD